MTTAVIVSMILGIVAIVAGVVNNYIKISKVSKDNEYINVINSKNNDINQLRREVNILHNKLEKLNVLIRDLDSSLLRSNAVSLSFPFPFWYKSADGKMIMLNDEYCKTYHKCREDYIGRTDHEVWDKETADKFKTNDEKTLNSQLGYSLNYDEEIEDTIIIKWKIQGLTHEENYVAGIAVPYKFIEDARTR